MKVGMADTASRVFHQHFASKRLRDGDLLEMEATRRFLEDCGSHRLHDVLGEKV
jgi:hypothetical protein